MGTIFGRPAPKIWEGEKTSKIRRDFWQLSILIAIIFGTDRHVESRKKNIINYPFHVGAKKFGELWSVNNRVKVAHIDQHKWTFFGRLYISAIRGCCPLKFISALEIDQLRLPSVHPNWDGGPPKKFNRENLNVGLKFIVWASKFHASGNILTKLL